MNVKSPMTKIKVNSPIQTKTNIDKTTLANADKMKELFYYASNRNQIHKAKRKKQKKDIKRINDGVTGSYTGDSPTIYVNPNDENEIKFFKFDENMKHFYVNHKKIIKKYIYETNTLVKNFEGHQGEVKDLVFTKDYSYIVR